MKLAVIGLVVIGALVVTQAQSNRCCGSIQFMAGHGGSVGQKHPQRGDEAFYTYQYGAWDFYNRMYGYMFAVDYNNGTTASTRLIQNYWEDVQYVIDDDQQYCEKQKPFQPEPYNCIPSSATQLSTYTLNGNWAASYRFESTSPFKGAITLVATPNSCEMLGMTFFGDRIDEYETIPFMTTGLVVNMTDGIPDRDKWYKIPSFCNQTNHVSSRRPFAFSLLDSLRVPIFV